MIAATVAATVIGRHIDGYSIYTARLRQPAPNHQGAIRGSSVIFLGHAPPPVVEVLQEA